MAESSTDGLLAEHMHVRRGEREAVRDVTLHAHPGQITSVIGPNGAGKSTLLRAICGLLPSTGSILLDGAPLSAMRPEQRARRLAFVPQNSLLSAPVVVRDVVAQGRYPHLGAFRALGKDDHRAVAEAMEQADVDTFRKRLFTELSFGEQRRVLLARALATGAQTILLDEPTASLDIAHALRLFAQLRELADAGRTLVVVLHQLDHVFQYTDRALLLSKGEARAQGTAREVIEPTLVREVYGVELLFEGGLQFRLPEAEA